MSPERLAFLKTFIRGSLEPAVHKIRKRLQPGERPLMVATSGTALSLGSLLTSEELRTPLKLHGYKITREKLSKLVDKLTSMNLEQRKRLTPLNDRRAEIIVPGALILETTMNMCFYVF